MSEKILPPNLARWLAQEQHRVTELERRRAAESPPAPTARYTMGWLGSPATGISTPPIVPRSGAELFRVVAYAATAGAGGSFGFDLLVSGVAVASGTINSGSNEGVVGLPLTRVGPEDVVACRVTSQGSASGWKDIAVAAFGRAAEADAASAWYGPPPPLHFGFPGVLFQSYSAPARLAENRYFTLVASAIRVTSSGSIVLKVLRDGSAVKTWTFGGVGSSKLDDDPIAVQVDSDELLQLELDDAGEAGEDLGITLA